MQNKYSFELSKKEKKFCFKNGFSYSDYGTYRYNEDKFDNYISTLDSYSPRTNIGFVSLISDNKLLFPFVLAKYFVVAKNYAYIKNGKILPLDDSGFDDNNYLSFLKNKSVIIKPMDGYDGFSINKVDYNNNVLYLNGEKITEIDLNLFIKEHNGFIVQETLKQDSFFNDLYPNSINTMRIISAKTSSNASHEIIVAAQRIGTNKSAPADNFSKGGLSALIDVESGRLSKATSAKSIISGKRVFFSKHPDTNNQIEGLIIPKWDYIKKSIIDFTRCFPFFEYIAWDICLNDKGEPMVIETNMKSSLGVFQAHGGLKGTKLDDVLHGFKEA